MKNILIKFLKKGGIFFTFIILLSIFFSQEYINFYSEKSEIENTYKKLDQLENFPVDSVPLFQDIKIYSTPDERVIDALVKLINNSQKTVFLNSYIFTEKNIKKAVIDAKKRGVDVKVIMEKNVYNAPNVNQGTYNELEKNGVLVKWTNSENFSLNHAKYIVLDSQSIVSTGNYSFSNFSKKRDFFLVINDEKLHTALSFLFLKDFEGQKNFFFLNNTVLSSYDARIKLHLLLNGTLKNLKIYAPYFQDTHLLLDLNELLKKGVDIEMIVNSGDKESKDFYEKLSHLGAKIRYSKTEIHAKAIEFDSKVLYVGSLNFSSSSIDKNREVGVLVSNTEVLRKFEEIFYKDFSFQK